MPGFTSETQVISNARTLTVSIGKYNNILPSLPNFTTFSADSSVSATSISVSANDTLAEVAARLDAIVGVSAKIVQTSAAGTEFSLVITSETGLQNAIRIDDDYSTADPEQYRFKTDSSHSQNANAFIQVATNAEFEFNGVDVSRETNTITDLVAGLQINLLSDIAGAQIISTSRSQSNIQKNVENLIVELNAYKADLDALGFVDEIGDENGQLANNSYLRGTKQKLMNLMATPITGYGDSNIHFVEFGIKTAVNGSYVFDQKIFDRTYSQAPEKFDALTQDKAYASDPSVFVYSTSDSDLPQGKHSFTGSDSKLNEGTSSEKIMSVTGAGPYVFSTPDYPGFLFKTDSSPPGDLDIYVGRSAQTRLFNFFSDALASTGNHDRFVESYEGQSSSLGNKLTKIDQREDLLQAMYTKRFSEMEKAVNFSTTSADYITQLVDGWNKD
jgi:flagellar hook-associated protein 2